MDQNIGSGGIANYIFIGSRIARNNNGTLTLVDSIAECRFRPAMFDRECSNPHTAVLIDYARLYVVGVHFFAAVWKPIRQAKLYIRGECLLKIRHEVYGSCRAPYWKRGGPASERQRNPSRQPEIGNANRMIGMQVS